MSTNYADPPPAVVYDPTGLQYKLENQLGRGGFAICWQAQQINPTTLSPKPVALKIVKSQIGNKRVAQKFITELQLHSKLHHPNLVSFHHAFPFHTSTYVVLELCPNGSLADWLRNRTHLSMPELRRCVIQTCGALKYLHKRNIVHRDLKTGNVFLGAGMDVKLGDFGLAGVLVSDGDGAVRRTTMCGTPNYIAPEVLEKGGRGHDGRVDVWAVGVLMYTLAIGRAPFWASKPDQILLRVAKGEYDWPDAGNEVPDSLREIVARVLVDEEERPSLDAIVSHGFFRMGYVPDVLRESVLTSRPEWDVEIPDSTAIKRGYTEAWYRLCKASGVGEYAPGKFFSVVGEFPSRSIYRECEREAESGKMPVVPMPEGAIYAPFVYKRGKGSTGGLEYIKEREMPVVSSGLVESSVNTKGNILSAVEPLSSKQGGMERQNRNTVAVSRTRVPASSYAESTKAARHPAVSNLKSAAKDTSVAVAEPEAGKPIAQLKPTTTGQLPIRPRTQSAQATSRTSSHDILAGKSLTSEPAKSTRATSWNTTRETGITKAVPSTRSTRAQTTRAATIGHNAPLPTRTKFKSTPPPPSTHSIATRSRNPIAPNNAPKTLYIDPSTILTRAQELRTNITTALTSSHNSPSTSCTSNPPTPNLPFITKWVDYTQKHGLGYILANGTIGVIANHTDAMPLTHILVEQGYTYFDTTSDGFTNKAVPFRFFVQDCDGGLEEVAMAGVVRRKYITLWARFARYMCGQLGGRGVGCLSEEGEGVGTIVRFYQRMGNVCVWGFGDGGFQFNFPDYTKIVLSADGKHASFTVLPLSAIRYMKTDATSLPVEFIKAREVVAGTVEHLLYGAQPTSKSASDKSEADVLALTEANAFRDKLSFVVEVVGCWIDGGGLGCKPKGKEWLGWEGLTLDDKTSKVDWVTVGRFGGDR